MDGGIKTQRLSGWGHCPVEDCHIVSPTTLAALHEIVTRGPQSTYIARGLGRAYGDAALNNRQGVIEQTRLDRFLSFDEHSGVLECEAGVSFAAIIEHLLPRGWFLPTTPGTKYVTVGGAIAADVHGKNHHHTGSLGNFLLEFTLLTASGNLLTCSPQENADVFAATLGGMGLTGVIISARLRLAPVESAYVQAYYRKTKDLDETLDSVTADHDYRYSVAWIDCLASGRSLGRGVLMLGNDMPANQLPEPLAENPLVLPKKRRLSLPFPLPNFSLNAWTIQAFNTIYYNRYPQGAAVVDYETFFYPLDHILHWNRLYGRRGFVQYQAFFPSSTARHGITAILEKVSRERQASFLAVLKRSGPASQGLLSFLSPGYTLALDLPNTGNNLRQLSKELDRLLLKHGGRLYLAKDAMTTAEAFAAMYPRLPELRVIKARLDPENRFVSSQARRLGIVEAT
jgi:FAD/FMN-containing dehydrogenase